LDGRVLLIPQTGEDAPAEFQHSDSVWDVRFNPKGEWLVSGDERGVRIWNTTSKTLFRQILLPAACHACLYAPDGESIIAACDDGICRILTAYGAEDRTIPNGSRINCVAVAPDGRHIAMGSDDAVKIWSLTADRQIAHIRYEGEVQWLAFSPDARHLAVASSDATARLWLWQTNDLIDEVRRRVRRTLTTEEWLQALPSEAPAATDSEPDLPKLVSQSEMKRLISLSRATKEPISLSEHTYDDLCRLAAFGLIRSKGAQGLQGITLNQAVQIESFFDLTPKGREFLRRESPATA
jgi:WD40 repeat protein